MVAKLSRRWMFGLLVVGCGGGNADGNSPDAAVPGGTTADAAVPDLGVDDPPACHDETCPAERPYCVETEGGSVECAVCREDSHCPTDHPHCVSDFYYTYCSACLVDAECPAGTTCTGEADCIDECRLDCRAPPPPPDPCRREGREAGTCDRECPAAVENLGARAFLDFGEGGDAASLSVAWAPGGADLGLLIQTTVDGRPALVFRRIDAAGRTVSEATVTRSDVDTYGRAYELPVLAPLGDGWAALWSDGRFNVGGDGPRNTEVYFRALGPDGTPRGDEVRVTSADGWSYPAAAVATGDTLALLSADRASEAAETGVYLTRLDATGRPTAGGAPVRLDPVGTESHAAGLAWDGAALQAVWHQGVPSSYWPVWRAQIAFGPNGALAVQAPQRLTESHVEADRATVVADAAAVTVAWRESASGGPSLRLARVASALDTPPGGRPADAVGVSARFDLADPTYADGPPMLGPPNAAGELDVGWSTTTRFYVNHLRPVSDTFEKAGPDAYATIPGQMTQVEHRHMLFRDGKFYAFARVGRGGHEQVAYVTGTVGCAP